MNTREHWEQVYATRPPTEVSWYQPHAERSLELIARTGVPKTARIVDVGGGASTLVDDLLTADYRDVTVADISGMALKAARERLGPKAKQVRWIEGDVLAFDLLHHSVDVWHDRAVFHFLTDGDDRRRYVENVIRSVKPGGFVIVATFAEDGPERCNGLPVKRYAAGELHAEFGEPFTLIDHALERHLTPGGSEQRFVYCFCRAETGHDDGTSPMAER